MADRLRHGSGSLANLRYRVTHLRLNRFRHGHHGFDPDCLGTGALDFLFRPRLLRLVSSCLRTSSAFALEPTSSRRSVPETAASRSPCDRRPMAALMRPSEPTMSRLITQATSKEANRIAAAAPISFNRMA